MADDYDQEPARDIDYISRADEVLLLKAQYAVLLAEHKQLQEYHGRLRKRLAKTKEKARRKRLLKGWDRQRLDDVALVWLRNSRKNIVTWNAPTLRAWQERFQVAHYLCTPVPTKEEFKANLLEEHKKRVQWYLLGSVEKFPCA